MLPANHTNRREFDPEFTTEYTEHTERDPENQARDLLCIPCVPW